jgi:hypothetical protein
MKITLKRTIGTGLMLMLSAHCLSDELKIAVVNENNDGVKSHVYIVHEPQHRQIDTDDKGLAVARNESCVAIDYVYAEPIEEGVYFNSVHSQCDSDLKLLVSKRETPKDALLINNFSAMFASNSMQIEYTVWLQPKQEDQKEPIKGGFINSFANTCKLDFSVVVREKRFALEKDKWLKVESKTVPAPDSLQELISDSDKSTVFPTTCTNVQPQIGTVSNQVAVNYFKAFSKRVNDLNSHGEFAVVEGLVNESIR